MPTVSSASPTLASSRARRTPVVEVRLPGSPRARSSGTTTRSKVTVQSGRVASSDRTAVSPAWAPGTTKCSHLFTDAGQDGNLRRRAIGEHSELRALKDPTTIGSFGGHRQVVETPSAGDGRRPRALLCTSRRPPRPESRAVARVARPLGRPGRTASWWRSSGPGARARPSSSATTAVSTKESPTPPSSSGMASAGQSRPTIASQRSEAGSPLSTTARTRARVHSFSRKERTESRNSSWSLENSSSTSNPFLPVRSASGRAKPAASVPDDRLDPWRFSSPRHCLLGPSPRLPGVNDPSTDASDRRSRGDLRSCFSSSTPARLCAARGPVALTGDATAVRAPATRLHSSVRL